VSKVTPDGSAEAYREAILAGVAQIARAPGVTPAALVQVCAGLQRSLLVTGDTHLAGTAMKLAPHVERVVQEQRMREFGVEIETRPAD
jgi:hypothetical protein